jgi:hypothetical protein
MVSAVPGVPAAVVLLPAADVLGSLLSALLLSTSLEFVLWRPF